MHSELVSSDAPKELFIVPIKRALLSVSDKEGLIELANFLNARGVEIITTGKTGQELEKQGIPFTKVEDITKKKEAFGGRMKTLSFEIFSSLLFRRQDEDDCAVAESLGIRPIDLLVCSFYPFATYFKKFKNGECDFDQAVENIDIGGPAMVRSAAKNFKSVTVLTDLKQCQELFNQIEIYGGTTLAYRQRNFSLAFAMTAKYEATISEFLSTDLTLDKFNLGLLSPLSSHKLRYGENAHQEAQVISLKEKSLADCLPLQGKELSYNNLLDADSALGAVLDLKRVSLKLNNKITRSAVVIIKHNNPCGVALATDPMEALLLAWKCDQVSAFGGIVAFSERVPEVCARWLSDKFLEVIVAPSFSPEALAIFSEKKNLRLIALPEVFSNSNPSSDLDYRSINGGLLVQTRDTYNGEEWVSVSKNAFLEKDNDLVQVGVIASKYQKSNAIALVFKCANGIYLPGSCGGRPNRIDSIKICIDHAQKNENDLSDAVLVSDAFFPFKDNIELINSLGIKKVVAPSGSIKDSEVVATCDKFKMRMAFTKNRHFRH